jgi:hypothetical protein
MRVRPAGDSPPASVHSLSGWRLPRLERRRGQDRTGDTTTSVPPGRLEPARSVWPVPRTSRDTDCAGPGRRSLRSSPNAERSTTSWNRTACADTEQRGVIEQVERTLGVAVVHAVGAYLAHHHADADRRRQPRGCRQAQRVLDGSFSERAGRGLDTPPVQANHGEDADAERVSNS